MNTEQHHKTFSDMPYHHKEAFPNEHTQAHELFILVQVSKRRYVVSQLLSRGIGKGWIPEVAAKYVAYQSFAAVTRPLPYSKAMVTLDALLAREVGLIDRLPTDAQEILDSYEV